MKVYLSSLGCKLNQAEMDDLARELASRGWSLAAAGDADVVVLNSCAVTGEAERKSRQAIRRLRAANPGARLVVTGCLAELSPEVVRECGAELVAGNDAKDGLAALLASEPSDGNVARAPAPRRRTRAMVRIQDGCDNACAYCVVHVARGRSRSRPLPDVLAQVRALAAEGYQEVVLTGVNIGAYGRDARGPSLGDLTRELLAGAGVPRLRWSSVEPWDVNPEWFTLWQDPRLCPHLHLPLQSGSDLVLARMNRRYTAGEYAALVRAAQAAIPDLAVTTDIIAGFPGETEDDQGRTVRLAGQLGLARLHVFPFSPRPGTPAARMEGAVAAPILDARAAELRRLSASQEATFRSRFIGRTMDVLWETRRGSVQAGLTGNYIRVETSSSCELWNRIVPAELIRLTARGVEGRAVEG